MTSASFLNLLLILWAAITLGFVGVMFFKSLASMKEEDVVILDPAESKLAAEQATIIARVELLTSWAKRLGFSSLGLLVLVGGLWAYKSLVALNSLQNP